MKKINRRTYLIDCYENEKGQGIEERHNKGFSAFALLGMLERIQLEIINQLEHQIQKPDIKKIYVGNEKIDNKNLEAK